MPTDPTRPPRAPNWRRRLVLVAILGSSTLYCLGISAFALKRHLLPGDAGAQGTVQAAYGATPTPAALFQRPTPTLEPTPTDAAMVYPTPLSSITPAQQPTQAATAATSPTPAASATPLPSPTTGTSATATPSPSPVPPTETPTATPQPSATATQQPTATPEPTATEAPTGPTPISPQRTPPRP